MIAFPPPPCKAIHIPAIPMRTFCNWSLIKFDKVTNYVAKPSNVRGRVELFVDQLEDQPSGGQVFVFSAKEMQVPAHAYAVDGPVARKFKHSDSASSIL